MEKASESTNHENGQLRAQVERLNNEVKEYRKRLSMTAPGVGLSPPTANPVPYTTYNHSNPNNDFVFAFPKFGDLPGTNFMNNGSLARTSPPATTNPSVSHNSPSLPNLAGPSSSQNSPTTKSPLTPISPIGLQGMTPHLQDQYQSPTTDQNSNSLDELNGLFSPSILETAKRSNSMDYMFPKNTPPMSTAPNRSSNADSYRILANTPGFTQAMSSGSTGSPSASSTSHAGLDSSCGTTPEPCGESPGHHKKSDPLLNTINEEASHNINHTQGKIAMNPAILTAAEDRLDC